MEQTVRFSVNLGETTTINFKKLLEEKYPTKIRNETPNNPEQSASEKPSEDDSNQTPSLDISMDSQNSNQQEKLDTSTEESFQKENEDDLQKKNGKNRMTDVISKIVTALQEGSYGYDSEDSFIDDSDKHEIPIPETDAVEYGEFFIHRGELEDKQKSKRKREGGEKSKTKKPKKPKKETAKSGQTKIKKDADMQPTQESKESNEVAGSPSLVLSKPPEPPKPTDTLEANSSDIEKSFKELEDAVTKLGDTSKLKRFPAELDPLLLKICGSARNTNGYLPGAVMERLCKILPFQKATLKARFNKLNNMDGTIQKLQQNHQEAAAKLKLKIASAVSTSPYTFDEETEILVFTLLSTKMDLIKATNKKKKLDDNTSDEKDIHTELGEYTAKLAQMWNNPSVDVPIIRNIYLKQKNKAKEQTRQEKDSTSESKKQSLSERRKKKASSEQSNTTDNNTTPQAHNTLTNIDLNAVGE
eukprot:CAMPEP_0168544294 /NCGR_PEP_ID=MMETSP0413-20121227/2345_1 /TAXON_ID=136452 /ORGANISM="Filamoeba nolandi, Strain NC-AS-23-1" /LENGTH=471 /DNA_ID=CAMNT_0008574309 /DNA_START=12 /DNA_END=1427 /DNA_ORIENTATION=+